MNPFALDRDCYVLFYDEDGLTVGKLYPLRMMGGIAVIKTQDSPFLCFPDIYDACGFGLNLRGPTRLGRFIQWIT